MGHRPTSATNNNNLSFFMRSPPAYSPGKRQRTPSGANLCGICPTFRGTLLLHGVPSCQAVDRRAGSAVRLDGDTRLHSPISFQSLCHDSGKKESVLSQIEGGFEPDPDIGDVRAEISVNLSIQTYIAHAAVQDPIQVLPSELDKFVVGAKEPGKEILQGRVNLVRS